MGDASPVSASELADRYVRTGEFVDLCDVIRSTAVLAAELPRNERHLRCILTELVNAFGLAMICALRRTDSGGIWRDGDEARLAKHNYERVGAYPAGMQIASPRVLWMRAKDAEWMANWGGAPIVTSERREQLVSFALELRDEFHHFQPKGWSINRQDMIEAAQEMALLIRELSEHAAFGHRLYGEAREELESNLGLIVAELARLKQCPEERPHAT